MKFIDLFAGLGNFHYALRSLGHDCVFASEKVPIMRQIYLKNHKFRCSGNIDDFAPADIPEHEILCAGFPCQPYSKAGKRLGGADPRSQPIFKVFDVLRHHQPEHIILENVPGLRNDPMFQIITDNLEHLGYNLNIQVIRPTHVGIPQLRPRLFFIGARSRFPALPGLVDTAPDLRNWLKYKGRPLTAVQRRILTGWDEIIKEFGAEPLMQADDYRPDLFAGIDASRKILDWKGPQRSIWDSLITIRSSGIRCARADVCPTLTTADRLPIIGWQKCQMSMRDAKRLQGMPENAALPQNFMVALGNAVCVDVIRFIAAGF